MRGTTREVNGALTVKKSADWQTFGRQRVIPSQVLSAPCREAQFLDPVDVRIARIFHQRLDPTRTPREMAIGWAEEERKAIERGDD